MVEAVDLLIDARWVVPVEPAGAVFEHHSVVVDKGKIKAILPSNQAQQAFIAKRQVSLRRHALIPGLVNLHTHAAMSLMRGIADDLPLMTWLNEHIWPAEKRHLGGEFVYQGTRLACAEMLKGGITTFSDMYFFPDSAARAAIECGMRAQLGITVLDFPTPYASDPDDYLAKGLAVRDDHGAHPRLSFSIAPHAPYTVSDATFEKVITYSGELDLPVHTHLHETLDEIAGSLKTHQVRPIERLYRLGLLGPDLQVVHMVHLEPYEIDLIAQHGCHVVHCPTSNLKLGSGIAPIDAVLGSRINVGLGTDGAASNNRLDLFSEMRLSALLGKGAGVSARTALEMATLGGARALGMENEIGSLLPGKLADMVAVDFSGIGMAPVYDPLSHLVYVAGRDQVSHVWVGGEPLLENGKLIDIDEQELVSKAAWWRDRVWGK